MKRSDSPSPTPNATDSKDLNEEGCSQSEAVARSGANKNISPAGGDHGRKRSVVGDMKTASVKRPRVTTDDRIALHTENSDADAEDEVEEAGVEDSDPNATSTDAGDGATHTFPQRLMEMLDKEVVPDTLWWTEGGKAFAIDLDKFDHVLHHHFQATKYASFTRKLNKWGFRKFNNSASNRSENIVVYRHDLFQRGSPELLASMSTKRKKVKKSKLDEEAKKEKKASKEEEGGNSVEVGAGTALNENRRSSGYASLSGRNLEESEAKASESKCEADFSLSSSLISNRRYLDHHLLGNSSSSLDLFQQQALLQGRLGMHPALASSYERERILLDPLGATDAGLLLRQRQREHLLAQQNHLQLSHEVSMQHQLATNPSLDSLGTVFQQDLLGAASQNTARAHGAIPVGVSSRLPDMQLQQNISNMSSSLRRFQSLEMGRRIPPQFDVPETQSLPDVSRLRREQANIGSDGIPRPQTISGGQGSVDLGAIRQRLALERQHPADYPADASSSIIMRQLIDQRQQELQFSRAAGLGLPVGYSPSPSNQVSAVEQRLLEITMEQQQLESRLLLEQRRRQQH